MIGIFDSGLGGIGVLNECIKGIRDAKYLYYADSLNAPYGDKSEAEIIALVDDIFEKVFVPRQVEMVVIACNTATNVAVEYLREKYSFPIIGIEPAVKPAVAKYGEDILVLATKATVNSSRFRERFNISENKINVIDCSGLMELIESGNIEEIHNFFDTKFEDIVINDIKGIVLGCTHYRFAKNIIESKFSRSVEFFDGAEGVAKRVNSLYNRDLEVDENGEQCYEILSSKGKEYNEFLKRYIKE